MIKCPFAALKKNVKRSTTNKNKEQKQSITQARKPSRSVWGPQREPVSTCTYKVVSMRVRIRSRARAHVCVMRGRLARLASLGSLGAHFHCEVQSRVGLYLWNQYSRSYSGLCQRGRLARLASVASLGALLHCKIHTQIRAHVRTHDCVGGGASLASLRSACSPPVFIVGFTLAFMSVLVESVFAFVLMSA